MVAGLVLIAGPAAALTQSWNGYHWARTGPLAITVGENVSALWEPYLATAVSDWSDADNIDFVPVAGTTSTSSCAARYGGVQVCSHNYGATGWLGYTQVWLGGGFIVQATIKLNDYYFNTARYNTPDWRQLSVCHELGHSLGLAHADASTSNVNLGTCLDLTGTPAGSATGRNGTLSNLHPGASDFAALDGIYARLDGSQLASTRPQYVAGDGYFISDAGFELELTAVPEPSSWALMILGFGAVGGALRRRGLAIV